MTVRAIATQVHEPLDGWVDSPSKASPGGGGGSVAEARKRLARAFVLCESQADGTVAARDVPHLLVQVRATLPQRLPGDCPEMPPGMP